MENIFDKVLGGVRISKDDALTLLDADKKDFGISESSAGITTLGMVADRMCRTKHPEKYRTYIIDRNINYTNVCVSKCRFCAFYKDAGDKEAYVLKKDELFKKDRRDN